MVTATLQFLDVPANDAQAFGRAALDGYVDGLRDAGWTGERSIVELGLKASAALLMGLGGAGLWFEGFKQEPRLIAFHVMLSDDGERFTSLQLHPDVQSMEFHINVVSDLIKDAGEVIEVETFTVLGASHESFDDYMKATADSGIAIQHLPNHLRGFTRSSAAD